MTQTVGEPINVVCVAHASPLSFAPQKIQWRKHVYPITKVSLHHQIHKGAVLYHVYSVMSDSLFLRISFNTKNLQWILEEISDGITD